MLDPDVVLDAVVTALRSITELADEMGGAIAVNDNVIGHQFSSGEENTIEKSIQQMTNPSILVAYDRMMGGNFDGQTVHKHVLSVYVRSGNRAAGSYEGLTPPSTLTHLWWIMMNRPILGSALPNNHIRAVELVNGSLDLMDTPSMQVLTDPAGSDYIRGVLVFPEKGDD